MFSFLSDLLRWFGQGLLTPPFGRPALYIQYVTEPGDSCGKINPFLPTRCRPTIEHSLTAGDAQRQWLQARLPDGHQPQCPFSACSP
jgi:hypothetical protein